MDRATSFPVRVAEIQAVETGDAQPRWESDSTRQRRSDADLRRQETADASSQEQASMRRENRFGVPVALLVVIWSALAWWRSAGDGPSGSWHWPAPVRGTRSSARRSCRVVEVATDDQSPRSPGANGI